MCTCEPCAWLRRGEFGCACHHALRSRIHGDRAFARPVPALASRRQHRASAALGALPRQQDLRLKLTTLRSELLRLYEEPGGAVAAQKRQLTGLSAKDTARATAQRLCASVAVRLSARCVLGHRLQRPSAT